MKIVIKDYRTWEPERSRNGGSYGFEETARVLDGKIVDGRHWTTSDFDYCPHCGSFEQHLGEHIERWHEGDEPMYQPSHEMEYAVALLGDHSPEKAATLFVEWSDGITLEVRD